MPTYLITAPDGRKFRVTGQGSRDDALRQVQASYQSETQPDDGAAREARMAQLRAQNPGEYDPGSKDFQQRFGPVAGRSFAQNFGEGVGKSFVDTGRGLKQLVVETGDALNIISPSMNDLVRGETPTQRLRREASEIAARDAPLMRTAGGVTGYIGGNLAQLAVPVGGVTAKSASLAGRFGTGALIGAALANTQPVTAEQTRLGNTMLGAAAGAGGEAVSAGIGKLVSPSARVSPEVAALAQKADDLGIPLRAEQVTGSRPLAGVSAALDTIPFSGRDAAREAQRAAFNRAVARTFGENTDNLTTAVKNGQARLGARYDAILKNNPVSVDAQFTTDLARVVQDAQSELTDTQMNVLLKQVQNIQQAGANGQINGQAAYNLKKILDRIGKSQDSSLSYHAGELRNALMEAVDRSMPAQVAKQFADTRAQYANLISVRRLLKAGADGGVTPARLSNVKNLRGDLKDVADVGATFLREPFGNSGTANRIIGASLLGGTGAGYLGGTGLGGLLEPATLGAASATIGTARAANALLGSRPVVNNILYGIPGVQPLLPHTNRLLPLLGASGAAGAIASQ
jgi:hypothetical protein